MFGGQLSSELPLSPESDRPESEDGNQTPQKLEKAAELLQTQSHEELPSPAVHTPGPKGPAAPLGLTPSPPGKASGETASPNMLVSPKRLDLPAPGKVTLQGQLTESEQHALTKAGCHSSTALQTTASDSANNGSAEGFHLDTSRAAKKQAKAKANAKAKAMKRPAAVSNAGKKKAARTDEPSASEVAKDHEISHMTP